MSYERLNLTPWARNAAAAALVHLDELDVPDGYKLHGFGRTSHGPWTFELIGPTTRRVVVHRVTELRAAIDDLFKVWPR